MSNYSFKPLGNNKNEMIKNLTNYSGAQRESNENAGLA